MSFSTVFSIIILIIVLYYIDGEFITLFRDTRDKLLVDIINPNCAYKFRLWGNVFSLHEDFVKSSKLIDLWKEQITSCNNVEQNVINDANESQICDISEYINHLSYKCIENMNVYKSHDDYETLTSEIKVRLALSLSNTALFRHSIIHMLIFISSCYDDSMKFEEFETLKYTVLVDDNLISHMICTYIFYNIFISLNINDMGIFKNYNNLGELLEMLLLEMNDNKYHSITRMILTNSDNGNLIFGIPYADFTSHMTHIIKTLKSKEYRENIRRNKLIHDMKKYNQLSSFTKNNENPQQGDITVLRFI